MIADFAAPDVLPFPQGWGSVMPAMLHAVGRVLATFALLIGVGGGVLAVGGPAQAARSTAYRVTVERTGGFAGVDESYTVLSNTVHLSTTDLMTTVNGREFRTLAPSYPAASAGADRYFYTVSVAYTNGHTETVTTADGADAPAVLRQVVDLTLRITADLAAGREG
ncbi:protealysin inhibitor emfourin [Micromonospora sp. MS34]|uniref:protealysin inhibitor emfourin n=1 Tax=Micromonospora sp. MS34 TaxID=3385971 RepID=UPI00399F871A